MDAEKPEKKVDSDDKKTCFFITPIGSKDSEDYKKLEGVKINVLEPVLEEFGYTIVIAHEIHNLGSIGEQVFQEIINANLIISNLTGLNANVMYETAVAHSFGKPTIMICEDTTNLPFDIISERTIFFENTISGSGILKDEIREKIRALIDDEKTDNPILRVLERSKLLNQVATESGSNVDKQIINLLFEVQDSITEIKGDVLQLKRAQPSSKGIPINRVLAKNETAKVVKRSDGKYESFIKVGGNTYSILYFPEIEFEEIQIVSDIFISMCKKLNRAPSIEELVYRTNKINSEIASKIVRVI